MKDDGRGGIGLVGQPPFTAGQAFAPTMALNGSGVPYIAYADGASSNKASCMAFAGGAWRLVGAAGFSPGAIDSRILPGREGAGPRLAFDAAGTPHIAFIDASSKRISCMKFSGGAWGLLGAAGFSPVVSSDVSLAIDAASTPHVAFADSSVGDAATVMRFSGGAWTTLGAAGFSQTKAKWPSLAFDGNTPYVGFCEADNGDLLTVMRHSGGAWGVVGAPRFTPNPALTPSFALAPGTGTPYVAYSGSNGQVTVMAYQ